VRAKREERAAWEAVRRRIEPEGSGPADNLRRARAEVDTWLSPFDAFDLIATLGLAAKLDRQTPAGPRRAIPSYVVEFVAVSLLRRDRRAPLPDAVPSPNWSGDPTMLEYLLSRSLQLSEDAEGAETYDTSLSPSQNAAQRRYMLQQLYGHDPVPPEREIERILWLFEPFESELFGALGFSAVVAVASVGALTSSTAEGLATYFHLSDDEDPVALRTELQRLAASQPDSLPGVEVLGGLGAAVASTPGEIAALVGVPTGMIEAFFEHLQIGFGQVRDGAAWSQIRLLRRRPLVHDGCGNWLAPVPFNLVYVLRGLFEEALRQPGGQLPGAYQKRRAAYLEDETRRLLGVALNPDLNLRSLSYEVGNGEATKLPEGDAFILCDRIGLACEAKAGGISPAGRGGEPKALAKAFRRLLFEAIEQAQRTRSALLSGRSIRGVGESTATVAVSAAEVSRVVPIAVTLEDLSSPSALLWELMEREPSDVSPADWPWIVNVDDLAWFAEELPHGAELIHYALVRQRLASAGEITVGNEADWFRFYGHHGAARAQAILDSTAAAPFHSQLLLVSDVRRGRFDPDLPPLELAIEPLVAHLDRLRPKGWLTASLALLDLHPDQAVGVMEGLRRQLGRADQGFTSSTAVRPDADPETQLTIWVGALNRGPRSVDTEDEPTPRRHVVLGITGSLTSPTLACQVDEPALTEADRPRTEES
jgi:hypothetical protein